MTLFASRDLSLIYFNAGNIFSYGIIIIYILKFCTLTCKLFFTGVGYIIGKRLEERGVFLCRDLQKFSLANLQKEFGTKTGKSLFDSCRGIDNRTINKEHQVNDVSI